jgi:fatty acid-binding protein DegV
MRIGLVVDSACDLPTSFLKQHDITILPISVRIDDALQVDYRDEAATLAFLHSHIAERGANAETMPFTVEQIRDLFLQRLVIDYDYVFCMTITKTRSPIFDNAQQASFAILNEYRPVRAAAGNHTPFALRVIDTQTLFCAQGIIAVEAVRLRDAGEGAAKIRARLEYLALHTHGYLIPRDLYYIRTRARMKGDRSVS